MRRVAPIGQRREPEPAGPHRKARLGHHGGHSHRPQERALARHVRPADHQRTHRAAQAHVVANAFLHGKQRMAQALGVETGSAGRPAQETGRPDSRPQ